MKLISNKAPTRLEQLSVKMVPSVSRREESKMGVSDLTI